MPRKKVVVDTSILIAAVITDGAFRKLLRKLIDSDFELHLPQEVINEFEKYIFEPKFEKYEPHFTQIFDEIKKSSILELAENLII